MAAAAAVAETVELGVLQSQRAGQDGAAVAVLIVINVLRHGLLVPLATAKRAKGKRESEKSCG